MLKKFALTPLLVLALAGGVGATPVWAVEAATPEPRAVPAALWLDAEAVPSVEMGWTSALARRRSDKEPARELSFPLAAGLTYGAPLAVGFLGSSANAILAPTGASQPIAMFTSVAFIGAFASGYIYAGEPVRGVLVTAGDLGVVTLATLAAAGIAVVIFGPGQSAGFGLPLVAIPVVGGAWVGYQVWKMHDLRTLIDAKNARARQL